MRPAERIRFSRVYTCSWCICHGISHKMIESSLNRHRPFLIPQNTDKFRRDEILFPVFVMIHHTQSLLDCQTWLAFFPYLITLYGIIYYLTRDFLFCLPRYRFENFLLVRAFLRSVYFWFLCLLDFAIFSYLYSLYSGRSLNSLSMFPVLEYSSYLLSLLSTWIRWYPPTSNFRSCVLSEFPI